MGKLRVFYQKPGTRQFRNDDFSEWEKNIRELAEVDNVMIKYSSFFLHSYPNCNPNKFKPSIKNLDVPQPDAISACAITMEVGCSVKQSNKSSAVLHLQYTYKFLQEDYN